MKDSINRRSFLLRMAGLTGGALLMNSNLFGSSLSEKGDNTPLEFAAISDLHHENEECDAWFRKLFADIAASKAEFALVLGDIANSGKRYSFQKIKDLAAEYEVPIFTTPGNHDCDLTNTTEVYEEYFPNRLNYSFTRKGWQFIVMDSSDGTKWEKVNIKDSTLLWLDDEMELLDPSLPTVVMTHFPVFHEAPYTLLNGEEIVKRLQHFNLQLTLSGHYHGKTEYHEDETTLYTQICVSRYSHNHDGTAYKGYHHYKCYPDGKWENKLIKFQA